MEEEVSVNQDERHREEREGVSPPPGRFIPSSSSISGPLIARGYLSQVLWDGQRTEKVGNFMTVRILEDGGTSIDTVCTLKTF